MLVIAPDNDAVIAAMLRLPREGALWWLEQWRVRERWIDARYRALRGPWAILRLVAHGQPIPAKAERRATERFVLVVVEHSRGAPIPQLLDTLEQQVRAHEAGFRWAQPKPQAQPQQVIAPEDVLVEQLAFEAGIKPALRLRLDHWQAPYEATLWLARGAALTMLEVDAGSSGACSYLMVARTLADAEALADAELRQYLPMPAQLDALRECGERLGYPPCCVDAFLRATDLEEGRDALVDARRGNFLRLDQAWVAHPHPHMNTLRQQERIGLLSFDPCSLACPAARALADRIAEAVEAACPGYVDELCGCYAIDHDDRRVALELDAHRRVRAARPAREDAQALADRIVGCEVDEHGRVPALGWPCRVFEFNRPTTDARAASGPAAPP